MTTTSVGMRCPECAGQRTKVKTMGSVTEPMLTYVLIGISVAVALGALLSGASGSGGSGLGASSLHNDLEVSRAGVANGDFWRLVTAGFLHYGLIHLLFNMYLLYVLGGMLEPAIGRLRFGTIYFVSLLAGSFGALLLSPDKATAGASGAVFGLMGAGVLIMRNRGINPMEGGLLVLIGLNLLITFALPNQISVGGHLGGLAGGALAALLLFDLPDRVKLPRHAPTVLAAAIGVVAIAGSIAVSSS